MGCLRLHLNECSALSGSGSVRSRVIHRYVVKRETWCFSDDGIEFDGMHDECDKAF